MQSQISFTQVSDTAERAIENAWVMRAKPEHRLNRHRQVDKYRMARGNKVDSNLLAREREQEAQLLAREKAEDEERRVSRETQMEIERLVREARMKQQEAEDQRLNAINQIGYAAYSCSTAYATLTPGTQTFNDLSYGNFQAWSLRHSMTLMELFDHPGFVVPSPGHAISTESAASIEKVLSCVSEELCDLFYLRIAPAEKADKKARIVQRLVDVIAFTMRNDADAEAQSEESIEIEDTVMADAPEVAGGSREGFGMVASA